MARIDDSIHYKIGYDTSEADEKIEILNAKIEKLVNLMKEAKTLANEMTSSSWELPFCIVLDGPSKGNPSRIAVQADV